MYDELELSSTDENAIRFLVGLTGLLVAGGTGRVLGADFYGAFIGMLALSIFATMAGLAAPGLYRMTMKDSLPILKMSLLIAVVLSFVGVFSANLAAPIAAVVFVISPIIYDFIRDIAFPNVPKEIPWSERRLGTKLVELVLEAAIGAIISLVIALALTGHF